MVSRVSRDRRAEATDAPNNAEGFYLDWNKTRSGKRMMWGRELAFCGRAGSKTGNEKKLPEVQKTLRDMYRSLVDAIKTASGGALSRPVLNAFTKFLMPGFLSSNFTIVVVLVVYVGAGFYAS
ncbi:hypothetical protein BC938DRAFT_477466, partial [Jimgerdemannia flammicorona]